MLKYQQACIEDLLIYSLKHNMSTATKDCLCNFVTGVSHLSRTSQVHLVLATLPDIGADEGSAAQLLDSNLLLLHCGLLRGLQFIRDSCLEAGGTESYCFATFSLNKIIVMHLLCNELNKNNIQALMEQLFQKDAAQKMVSNPQNVRLINLLKRDIKKFQGLVEMLLQDEDACSRYIQGAMWDEYGESFWKKLQLDLQDYIRIVHSHLPAVKIETVLENIKTYAGACDEGLLTIQSCLKQDSIEEKCVIALIKHLKQSKTTSILPGETTPLNKVCENKKDASSHVGCFANDSNSSRLTTGQFYSKKLSVCLADVKLENTSCSLYKIASKKRPLDKTPENSQTSKHLLSMSARTQRLSKYTKLCAVEVADVLSDDILMEKYSPRGRGEGIVNSLNSSSSSLDSLSTVQENKENLNETEAQRETMSQTNSSYKQNGGNAQSNSTRTSLLEISNQLQNSNMKHHSESSTSSSTRKRCLRKTKSKTIAKAQACRKLSYVGTARPDLALFQKEAIAERYSDNYFDDVISESDCSDSDGSEILELDGPHFPDFSRFQFTPTCHLSDLTVTSKRLKPQMKKRDTSHHYFIDSCKLNSNDTLLLLHES